MHQDANCYGGRPQPRRLCVIWGPCPSPLKGRSPIFFGPCLLWLSGCMDQDATWYEGRPRPRPRCGRWGPAPPKKGAQPHNFRPMFVVAKQLPISATGENLLHSSRQSVTIVYKGAATFPPYNYSFPWGTGTPSNRIPWAHLSPQPKRHLDRFTRFRTDDHRMFQYFTIGHPSPIKIAPSRVGCGPRCNTCSLGPPKSIPKRHLDWVSRFCTAHGSVAIYIYKAIGNCAISSTAANWIVERLYTLTR